MNVIKCILVLLPFAELYAQEISPSITIGGNFFPSRELKDTTGNYGHQRAHVGFAIPLLKRVKATEDGLKFYLLSFGTNASADHIQLSFLRDSRTLLTLSSSINGMYRSSRKSLWISKLTGSYFEDQTTVRNPTLRFSGFAMYRRTVNESFFYLVGGAYSFSYGIGLPLPLIGMGWRFTNRGLFTFVLPLSINYHFGKPGSQFTIFLRPNGSVSNFYNNNVYPTSTENIVFRRREFTLGIKKKIRLSNQWSLQAEAGLVTARKIIFSNDFKRASSSTIFDSKVQPGPYLSVGLRYKFKVARPLDTAGDEIDVDSLVPN